MQTYLKLFETDYARLFGRTVQGMEAEITVWSVNAFTKTEAVEKTLPLEQENIITAQDERLVFDPALSRMVQAQLVRRAEMQPAIVLDGPALVCEDETTIVVPASRQIVHLNDGSLDLRLKITGKTAQKKGQGGAA